MNVGVEFLNSGKMKIMKKSVLLFAVIASVSFASCDNGNGETTTTDSTMVGTTTDNTAENPPVTQITYYDLRTGSSLKKDDASGKYLDESGVEAEFYVDPAAGDTFYSQTGQNVNNSLSHENDTWRLNDGENGKVKVTDDKMKIKTDDQKIKVKDADNDGSGKVKIKDK